MFYINSIEIQRQFIHCVHFTLLRKTGCSRFLFWAFMFQKSTVCSYTNTGIAHYKATKRTMSSPLCWPDFALRTWPTIFHYLPLQTPTKLTSIWIEPIFISSNPCLPERTGLITCIWYSPVCVNWNYTRLTAEWRRNKPATAHCKLFS